MNFSRKQWQIINMEKLQGQRNLYDILIIPKQPLSVIDQQRHTVGISDVI